MEQATPFPRMPSPPPPKPEPSPTPSHPPGLPIPVAGAKIRQPIHPAENVFPTLGIQGKETVTLSEPGPTQDSSIITKPVGITQEISFDGVRKQLGPFIVAQPIEQNDRLQKLRRKKEERERKKERNVKVVKKAEDMEGYEGEKSINDLLQSLGEKTAEEKKQKLRKTKDHKEKKERKQRRSVEKTSEDDVREEEDDGDKEQQMSETVNREPEANKNGVMESLQEFGRNFNLTSSESSELRSLKSSEGLTQSTDSLNFVKVTGKKKSRKLKDEGGTVKEYTRRSKEDTGRPPPAPGGTLERKQSSENRRTSNYTLRSRDVPLPAESPASPPPTVQAQSKLNSRIDDFPALNTSQDFPALPQSEPVTESLPPAWNRRSAGSDSSAVITTTPPPTQQQPPQQPSARRTCDTSLTIQSDISSTSEQDSVENCDRLDAVRRAGGGGGGAADQVDRVASDVDMYGDLSVIEARRTSSTSSVADPLERIGFSAQDFNNASPEKFEFDTRSNPVVGDSFLDPDELSFGFEVNEELVSLSMAGESTAPPSPLQSGQTTPRPASPAPSGQSTPRPQSPAIDTMDKAILSYSSAGKGQLPGVLLPYGLVGGVNNNGIPPPFSNYLPQVNSELLETGLCESEDKSAAVSPESGISSASPLSWQVEGSPSHQDDDDDEAEVERSSSPPLQPGSYPRKKKQEERTILQQVNHSLKNWSRASSPDSRLAGYMDISNGESTAPNYPEIVNFLHNNWKEFSKDKKVKFYGDKKRR